MLLDARRLSPSPAAQLSQIDSRLLQSRVCRLATLPSICGGPRSEVLHMRLGLGLGAAALFAFAGYQMIVLESEAGNTVAEAFYNAVGWLSLGLAVLSVAVGIPHPVSDRPTIVAAEHSLYGGAAKGGFVPIEGWAPTGSRECPSCSKTVAIGRETHCNHCGTQLLVQSGP